MIIYNKLTIINLLFKRSKQYRRIIQFRKIYLGSGELSNLGKYTKRVWKKMLLITQINFYWSKF